jgi:hypothetical protein
MFNTIMLRTNGNPVNRLAVFLVSFFLAFAAERSLPAQSSPLTVQPSTSRVGVNTTTPGYTLDVNGTVNATSLRGDGSQLTNLPASGGSAALNKVTADTTVANNAAETNLYSFSTAGGTLSTNNVLRLTVQITDLDMIDGDSCVLRFKYGGTTLVSITLSGPTESPVTNEKALITMVLAADGATNSQVGSVVIRATASTSASPNFVQGTSAVDSTVAQTFAVTADWNFASTGNSITLGQAILEKIS